MKTILGKQLNYYQIWQATVELYLSQIEASCEGLSGIIAIHRRKQIEAIKGFIKLCFVLCADNFLSLLNLINPLEDFRLGFKQEADITNQST
tara:strand:- start:37 stop:312 length:276 start_codon:yes stop_codon:yes gene_type:complete